MRILCISAAFPPLLGGESDHTVHMATRLAAHGLDVELLTVQGAEASDRLPFKVHPIMQNWSWQEVPRLMRFLRRRSPDGIFLYYTDWLYGGHPMITFAPTIAKWMLPHSVFVTQSTFIKRFFPGSLRERALRKAMAMISGPNGVDYRFGTLLRDSDSLIIIREANAAELMKLDPTVEKKLMVIPPPPLLHMVAENGGESRRLGREKLGLGDDDFVVAFYGVIYRGKGLETLLGAFKKVASKRPNARLILIGGQSNVMDGLEYFNEIVDLSRRLKIDDRLIAQDYDWKSSDGSLYLHAADVCVLPFENGVVLSRSSFAGAAAHRLPIITTKGEFLESAFKDGENVLLCPPKDPDALFKAINAVADSTELRARLSEGAGQMADEWFSWDKWLTLTVRALTTKPTQHPSA